MCLLFVFHGTYFSTPLLKYVCMLQPQAAVLVCVYATASGCCAGLGVGICMSNYIAETDSKW